MPDLEIYYFPTSFYTQRVLMALEEKSLPYKRHLISLPSGENHSAWFMQINPQGQLPVLRDGKEIIVDSDCIIKHLDERFSSNHVIASDPDVRKQMEDLCEKCASIEVEILTYGTMYHDGLSKNAGMPSFGRKMAKDALDKRLLSARLRENMKANPGMADVYEPKIKKNDEMQDRMVNKEYVEKQIRFTQSVFRDIEDHLNSINYLESPEGTWLCGNEFTLADIYLAIILGRIVMVGLVHFLWEDGQMPAVAEYYRRVKQRASYKSVVYESMGAGLALTVAMDKFGKALPYAIGLGVVGVAACFGYKHLQQ